MVKLGKFCALIMCYSCFVRPSMFDSRKKCFAVQNLFINESITEAYKAFKSNGWIQGSGSGFRTLYFFGRTNSNLLVEQTTTSVEQTTTPICRTNLTYKIEQTTDIPFYHFFLPVSHFFMLNGPNSNFKFITGQPHSLHSPKKGQKLTEYNPFTDRSMHTHTRFVCVYGDNLHIITIEKKENLLSHKKIHSLLSGSAYHNPQILI